MNLNKLAEAKTGEISPMAKSWTNVASGIFRRPRAKAALLDFQCANLRFERRTRDSEPCSPSRGTEDAPLASPQGIFNDSLLMNAQRARQAQPSFDLGARIQPALGDAV